VNIHKKVWTRKPESFGFDIAFLKKYVSKKIFGEQKKGIEL
jgi:hypothetical protein